MAILNLTYRGRSADLPGRVELRTPLIDLRRIAFEVLQSGGSPSLAKPGSVTRRELEQHVVDRFETSGGPDRVYLRPRVPFG